MACFIVCNGTRVSDTDLPLVVAGPAGKTLSIQELEYEKCSS